VLNPLWDKIVEALESSYTATKLHPTRLMNPALGISSNEAELPEGRTGFATPFATFHGLGSQGRTQAHEPLPKLTAFLVFPLLV